MSAGSRRLAAALVHRAYKDALKGDLRALCWLASKRASWWFDLIEVTQSALLARSEWPALASEALQELPDTHPLYTPLARTLAHLERL